MASGLPHGWLPTLARRAASISRAALNPPVRHVSRFPYGYRNMASSSAVKVEELGKADRRRLTLPPNDPIRTTKGITISMEKHFPITRSMCNEENRAAIEEVIARCHGDGCPTNVEQDGSKIVADGSEDVKELTDGEEDAGGQ